MESLPDSCETKVCISKLARENSQLDKVYKDLRNRRCSLEIVGVANFYRSSENELIVMVKVEGRPTPAAIR